MGSDSCFSCIRCGARTPKPNSLRCVVCEPKAPEIRDGVDGRIAQCPNCRHAVSTDTCLICGYNSSTYDMENDRIGS